MGRTGSTWGGARTAAFGSVAALLVTAILVVPPAMQVGATQASVVPTYNVGTILVGGDGATGVAVDPVTNTIYAAQPFGGTISVIDGANGTVTATVTVGDGKDEPNSVAVNPITNTIYATDNSHTISVIDGATNRVTVSSASHIGPVGSRFRQ
jgi:DNA-binding beta-propeller fold protein YncE